MRCGIFMLSFKKKSSQMLYRSKEDGMTCGKRLKAFEQTLLISETGGKRQHGTKSFVRDFFSTIMVTTDKSKCLSFHLLFINRSFFFTLALELFHQSDFNLFTELKGNFRRKIYIYFFKCTPRLEWKSTAASFACVHTRKTRAHSQY